ncbi:MAG TPA: hypothetical protein VIP77_24745 [Jiangellaceae bacterium]
MRRLPFLAISVLLAVGAGTAPATATATPPPPPVADVAVTVDGLSAPSAVDAGRVTMRVSSSDPDGAWVGLVRLRRGVTVDEYLADLRLAFGHDPAQALAGARAIADEAIMLGGGAVANTPVSVSVDVDPGTYYLVDFLDVALPDLAERIHPIVVSGRRDQTSESAQVAPEPRPTARITHVDTVAGPRFRAPDHVEAGAPIEVANRSRQFNEAIFMPVRPGTTDLDVDAYFRTIDSGGRPETSPFTGGPTGLVPMSPDRTAVLTVDLPPGQYALVTWVRDLRTGHLLAAEGMHTLVTIG